MDRLVLEEQAQTLGGLLLHLASFGVHERADEQFGGCLGRWVRLEHAPLLLGFRVEQKLQGYDSIFGSRVRCARVLITGQEFFLNNLKDLSLLVLDHRNVEHRHDSGEAVGEDFGICLGVLFSAWLSRLLGTHVLLLHHLRQTHEIGGC